MAIVKPVVREMPDKSNRRVYPFHLSMEGLEKAIICRDNEDYDIMVKYIFLCAWRLNTIVVTYTVVSNHLHVILLAENDIAAKAYGDEVRRRYAMWFTHKWKERKLYQNRCVDVQWLDSDWYLRNAIAYVLRNALDNGVRVEDYPWSGYRALFSRGHCPAGARNVASLTKREREHIFHTNDDISRTGWLINRDNQLEPVSACDYQYAEAAFNNSQPFLLKMIGSVNCAEMQQRLIDGPRTRMPDTDFFNHITSVSERWFGKAVSALSPEQKSRLVPYIFHTTNTSIPQLARGFALERDIIAEMIDKCK